MRYDLSLEPSAINALKPDVTSKALETITTMDEPKNMPMLKELADLDATVKVDGRHFPGR